MKDANGGTGVLKGYLEEVELTCGAVSTKCDLHVGEGLPFDLLLGRKWQRRNLVTIAEKKMAPTWNLETQTQTFLAVKC